LTAPIDAGLCEKLVTQAVAGDPAAARQLVEHLWPSWIDMVRSSRSLGPAPRSDDQVHDVVARLVEKFGKPEGRSLRLYAPWKERNPEKTFADWIRIVVKNVIRDYAREKLGTRRAQQDEISVKRLLNEFASSPVLEELGVRPPITSAQTARELMEFAHERLPADQLRSLGLWLEGASFEDMGADLRLAPQQCRQLLRAAVATLRRQFTG
jgi:RNA polymerase sigma factor (sigma-70 family)